MALTEDSTEDITVTASNEIHVKTVTHILRDGVEVSATIHRGTFAPGSDISGQSDKVQSIAELFWTPEILEAIRLRGLAEDAANAARAARA